MKISRVFASVSTVLVFATACGSDSYDFVPVDARYTSSASGGFEVTLANGDTAQVQKFGLAIGFTRIHLCEEDLVPSFARTFFRDIFVSTAHAHSPSTPTSSGIPVVLSTEQADAESLVEAALRPVRGVDVCRVEIQLLNADDDARLLDLFPDIENHASTAFIDDTWVHSHAGPSRFFEVDPPLHMDGEIQFTITLDGDLWEANRALDPAGLDSLEDVGNALQDAGMESLTLDIQQHIPADE